MNITEHQEYSDYEICPECGRDADDHKINNHYCEFTKERIITMISVHKSFIEKVRNNDRKD